MKRRPHSSLILLKFAPIILICFFLTAWFVPLILKKYQTTMKVQTLKNSSNTREHLENMIWERKEIMDPKGRIQMKWNFTKEDITIMVIAATTGHVGIGFTLNSNMTDADIIVAEIQHNKVNLYDYFTTGDSPPILDPQQDLELKFGKENSTHKIFCFKRKLNTCDNNDIVITTSTMYGLWFLYDEDLKHEFRTSRLSRNRGSIPLHLLDTKAEIPSLEEFEYFDVGANNTNNIFKWKSFYYWCQFIKLPDFGEQHHLIAYVPKIDPKNIKAVHHINVYDCGQSDLDISNDPGHMCWFPANFNKEVICRRIMISWPIGAKGEYFPSHVGYPFGSTKDKPHYIRVEVHYNYKYFKRDFLDSSKLRLYHTKNLRPNVASAITVAARQFQIIPAHQLDFPTIGICSPTCTQNLPPTGIHIFRYLFHAHKAVTKMRLHHFRNGTEINTLFDDNMHFDYQQGRFFKEELVVLPNDILAVECLHDTTSRNLTTMTGMGSDEEMCLMIMQYYPPIELSVCYSALHPKDVQTTTPYYYFSQNDTIEFLQNPYIYLTHFIIMTLHIRYIPLTTHQANNLRKLYLEGAQIPMCLNGTTKLEYYTDEIISYSQLKLTKKIDQCQLNR